MSAITACPSGHPYADDNVYSNGDGRRRCRECRRARARRRAAGIREKHRAMVRGLKDRPCADCGSSYPFYVMEFDHREGEDKSCGVSHMVNTPVSTERLLEEVAKCDLVCANCHRERTAVRAFLAGEWVV